MSTDLSAQEQTALALRMWEVVEYVAFAAAVRNIQVALGLEEGCCADVRAELLRQSIAAVRRAVSGPRPAFNNN